MSPLRLPRWTAVLVLPLLAGALLLMHGLDAGATSSGLHAAPAAALTPARDAGTPGEHRDDGHCEGCTVGHVMAACVAIAATVAGLRLASRVIGTRRTALAFPVMDRIRALRQVLRPPDPAWVRLAVMRC